MSDRKAVGVAVGFGAVMVGVFAYAACQAKPRLRVAGLYCYPIKSCAPVELDSATFDMYGFMNDRRWVVVERESGEFLHQRKHKSMATIKTAFDGNYLVISAPHMKTVLRIDMTLDDRTRPRRKVVIFGQELTGVCEGEEAAAWFTEVLGVECILCRRPSSGYVRDLTDGSVGTLDGAVTAVPGIVAYCDEHPVLVCTTASLRDLNSKLENSGKKSVPMSRFRPNVVLDEERGWLSAGKLFKGFIEHDWKEITVGDVSLLSTGFKTRCVMTTIDQATGTTEPRHVGSAPPDGQTSVKATNKDYYEPVTTLRGYRLDPESNSPVFGETFSHTRDCVGKTLKVGDVLKVIQFKKAPSMKATA